MTWAGFALAVGIVAVSYVPLALFIWWDTGRPESVEARARVARINAEYERVFGAKR